MGTFTKTNTDFRVQKQGSGIKAEGDLSLNGQNQVRTMYLTFIAEEEEEVVGSVNYDENDGKSYYNYSIQANKHKSEIMNLTETILQEMKEQCSLEE